MKKTLFGLLLLLLSFSCVNADNISEQEKIQWHLYRTESILRSVDISELTQEQKDNRSKNLDILNEYTKKGDFPNNDSIPGSTPFFQGSNGNLCAVGYLMNHDPYYQSYVSSVVNTNNNIKVMDINDEVFDSWLNKNGFKRLEAAMIQPSYAECMNTASGWGELSCKHYNNENKLITEMLFIVFILSLVIWYAYTKKIKLNKVVNSYISTLVNGGIILFFSLFVTSWILIETDPYYSYHYHFKYIDIIFLTLILYLIYNTMLTIFKKINFVKIYLIHMFITFVIIINILILYIYFGDEFDYLDIDISFILIPCIIIFILSLFKFSFFKSLDFNDIKAGIKGLNKHLFISLIICWLLIFIILRIPSFIL